MRPHHHERREPPAKGKPTRSPGDSRWTMRCFRWITRNPPPMIPNARQDARVSSWAHFSGLVSDDREGLAHWIRECGVISLPPFAKASRVAIRGDLFPWPRRDITVRGPIGLRVSLNGHEKWTDSAIKTGPFELEFDLPAAKSGQFSTVELRILGVSGSNFFAWLGRITQRVPMPLFIREPLQRFRRQNKNRQLRIHELTIDGETVFDFGNRHSPYSHAFARRWFKLGINVVGFHRADLGVGQSARCMVAAADAAGLPVAVVPLKVHCRNPHGDDALADRLTDENPHPVNVVHIDAPQSRDIDHHHGKSFRANKYNIAYWAWELPEFPDAWLPCAGYFDEIWTPSNFVRDAVAAKLPHSVHTMPHAINFARPVGNFRKKFGLPEGKFLFLFIYDLNSYSERKNPRAVLDAWRLVFPDGGETGVVIKVQNRMDNPGDWERLRDELGGLPNAVLLSETMKRSEIYELQSACDCFVSLHRSEGFGLSVAECMYLGKPVIATNWSATAEYVNAENGCPVDFSLVQLDRNIGPYGRGQTWAEPDVEHAAAWMKRLAGDPELCARLGAQARTTIETRFSPKAVGALYRRRLEAIASW